MGSYQSTQIQSITEILNKNVTNVLNEQSTNVSSQLSAINTIDLTAGDVTGCDLIANQTIKSNQVIDAIAKLQTNEDLVKVMKGAIDKSLADSKDAINSFLSTTFSQQDSMVDIQNKLDNIIENNISNVNTQNVLSQSISLNKGKYTFGNITCREGQKLDFSQKGVVDQYVKSVVDLMGKILMQDQEIANTVEKVEEKKTAKSTGVAEFFKALTGPWVIFIVGLVIVFFLFVKFGGLDKLEKLAEKKL